MRRITKRLSRPGHFDAKVTIYKQDASQAANTDGEFPELADSVGTRWAEVVPLRGQLRQFTSDQRANISHIVRMRRDSVTDDITPNYWLVVSRTSQRLNVMGVVDVEARQRFVELECTERLE